MDLDAHLAREEHGEADVEPREHLRPRAARMCVCAGGPPALADGCTTRRTARGHAVKEARLALGAWSGEKLLRWRAMRRAARK